MKNVSQTIMVGLLAAAFSVSAYAGPGHDHGDEPQGAANSNGPKRLPDGSVFLPKITQRQLAVRTIVAEGKEHPQAFELVGRVVMDPNAGGKVQPMVAGRVEPGPKGLPSLGQTVRKGEVLAYVRPSTGSLERANQVAQAAELRSTRALAEKRLARLKQLEGTVPQKEIEAAEAEVASAKERLTAIGGSLSTTEALTAPVSGVVSAANVVAGQVIDAREVLFEIVDPSRLRVEAVAHDATLATNIATATARATSGESIPLEFVGAGRTLREQTVPIQFRTRPVKDGVLPVLTVGQPIKVIAQSKTTVPGVAVPASAIVKNPSNQDIVWVHEGAERFVQRPIRFAPLDANTVTVTSGLKGNERVVVQGAPLVNQVR
ncbi:efflux RND transporter periplasmic adaptor subunit [Noviherbaspirillum sp. CPCC 100848]|uniref:Efflux RND transporter periplasmic adaptor subunit n=1 Tax=Noviherbaspirillum album TaxID=3080276 RepID=A0ABU6JFP7_9BURK|nr:HlyD family efflux transporter periplasmic adaptor subunit [Noviherbaspirillum sp. CPCC 100848]MEC4722238.1 efflux RND transporter periplasmic adaptor subunit [Noviherbaspirillum sp. CPCC 100848]